MSRAELREAILNGEVVTEDDVKELSATVCEKESKTRQADLDASDINKIVKRYERDGILPLVRREGAYLDVSEVGDYRQALEQVRAADQYFSQLPAESRAMFDNDPAQFLDVVNDPDQLQLLVDAGVVPKDEVRVPVAAAGSESPPEGGGTPGKAP